MPALRTYRIFISHAWHRSEHYTRVVDWLNGANNLRWENLSVPEHRPVPGEDLAYGLRNQMRPADVSHPVIWTRNFVMPPTAPD